MQCIRDCAQWCCSCSHAEPASFCEHTREGSQWTRNTTPLWKADWAKLMQPSRFQPVVPVPPLTTAKPLSCHCSFHCSSRKQNHPNFLPRFISRHMMEKQVSVAKRKMKGQLERYIKHASQPSLPSAAYRIRNLPNIYREQVTSTWK